MTKKKKKYAIRILALTMSAGAVCGFVFKTLGPESGQNTVSASSAITRLNGSLERNTEDYFDEKVVYKLPESVSSSQEISVIVSMNTNSVLDAYERSDQKRSVKEFVASGEARTTAKQSEAARNRMIKALDKSGVKYVPGEKYDTVLSGFEITIKAKDFEKVNELFENDATLIVGDVYAPAESQVITNDVDVYETGIFDSSSSAYKGDGVVVAVLDTGLDYTHTAFSVENFNTSEEAFTLSTVAEKIGKTSAAKSSAGLTAEDVYVSRKVPYAYDYADKDADVAPISSEHGTHVAGVIAGKDDTITGVAPNAQLAIMKVFSDTQTGAKTSWILAALEDCVMLGVDVINMSLGSGCGFTREVDEEKVAEVYDGIRAAGISLVVSAGNSYNATFSSEKNGNNGLTSNPDSGTVGSPSTYEASLSVASVDGVKTPYLLYGDDIIYFTEASTSDAQTKKSFVDDILKTVGEGVTEHEFEYVTIPGIGRTSDYMEENEYYHGKIVLVKRGTSTFEEKVRVALKEKGAAGIIIYNNVSGNISMSVGANIGAVCSLSQDEGEKLAKAKTGVLKVSKTNTAGPFMSDFSSWGPTSDLKIKPEITAHGGEILSAVPGQNYKRMSGTSMAAPNQAGATALIRQYVRYSGVFGNDALPATEVTKRVNQLMMSTADIVMNKNGLPYAVRKQGAGLVNISKATTTPAYISTYDDSGNEMDKTKLELGDDKNKTGVYEMTFAVNNIGSGSVSYNVDAVVMTEGVSSTYTSHGDTTVTQDGYLLTGTQTQVTSVSGGTQSGNTVTVQAGQSARITLRITLSESDKQYLNESFENGMYVEGFVKLIAQSGTGVSLNVPMLAFYGDWTQAPVFDEEYYDTNKDELNAGLDTEDKLMADAYATRVIGGLYSDYISTLGAYAFTQDPSATPISANKDRIAISNQEGENGAISKIRSVTAGLLRNAKKVDIVIKESSTGRAIYSSTQYNVRKSFNGGGSIYGSSIDLDFSALKNNLKNNTKYIVTLTSYIDYGGDNEQNNARNVFEFPLYIDFEAPVVTDVVYHTEYDSATKKTRLFADVSIYDNHYAMGVSFGQIVTSTTEGYLFSMKNFGKYVTPVYSSFNSTSVVTVELTDYVSRIKNDSLGVNNQKNNSFIASCYDYALNVATYEIRLPDEILSMYFNEETIKLNPNETKPLSEVLNIFPNDSWIQTLSVASSATDIADIINQTIVAKRSGDAIITASGYNAKGEKITASATVHVLAEGEEGYNGTYTVQTVNNFMLTGYTTNKAYYSVSSSEREIGVTGGTYSFGSSYSLSMYPSESVTLHYALDSYYPDATKVVFSSGNKNATVTEDGTIVAIKEGRSTISAAVTYNGASTLYMLTVSVTIKNPFNITSIYLNSYKGLGGEVTIPADRGITTIQSYAFSGYELVEKDVTAGDVIDKESPYYTKQSPLGEDTITKVVIPEGITTIEAYAFADLTALEEVVLPSTLNLIGVGAFKGCKNLSKINLEHVQFINERAFSGCDLQDNLSYGEGNFAKAAMLVSIGNYAFENCKLNTVVLPETAQSIGIGAFYANKELTSAEFSAYKVKVGKQAFAECENLLSIDINASVISAYAFYNCTSLKNVRLGEDVSVIGEYAFAGTKADKFEVASSNEYLTAKDGGRYIFKDSELILAAPKGLPNIVTIPGAKSIATGAFSKNTAIFELNAPDVTSVGDYAFADCINLKKVTTGKLKNVGAYAFGNTAITATPDIGEAETIRNYAFAFTDITSVTLNDGVTAGDYSFAFCTKLQSVTIGNDVTVGEAAFYSAVSDNSYESTGKFNLSYYNDYVYEVKDEEGVTVKTYTYYSYDFASGVNSSLTSLTIGKNVTVGDYAFAGNARLTSVVWSEENGAGVKLGDYSFFNAVSLASIDLSNVEKIGDAAFSGLRTYDFRVQENTVYPAYKLVSVGGKETATEYMYTAVAAQLTSADLSAAKEVGTGAFANNKKLQTATIGDLLTAIPDYAFSGNVNLTAITLPQSVTEIGEYAFYNTGLTNADLTRVTSIGAYAFARTSLTEVSFGDTVTVGDAAFAYCGDLAIINGLEKATQIGAYAFMRTAINEAELTGAEFIGDFAFAYSSLTGVILGEKLAALGENPFYGCEIATYGKKEKIIFGNTEAGERINETYEVSARVKVLDGVLYQSVPNGLELVSYPMERTNAEYAVEEGTVRIAANAFAGNLNLKYVTIAYSVQSIGDKAFYGCNNLAVTVFLGYDAPALEEEYDTSYISSANKPYNDGTSDISLTEYFIWNSSSGNLFYYGATFVDRIGHTDKSLVMVRPANGNNYDTFIFSQYFAVIVDGNNAATLETLNVISMIADLGSSITLQSEFNVNAARAAFDALPLEQQALVSNLDSLETAEGIIRYLKSKEPTEPGVIPGDDDTSSFSRFMKTYGVGIAIAAVAVLGAAAFAASYSLKLKKKYAAKGVAQEEPEEKNRSLGGREIKKDR
ncbi:MAG: leucine-rich repeat protein [Candidatus Borkfalkiaceae bacterium]|nr:leucine-rich repeat protein [Clostridia bacterium]MDY6223559.1 leucine-rich repeat protein [Christensenellaceae bacterium]